MRILLGVVLSGTQKGYCVPKFLEQCEKVFADVDILFVTDLHNYDGLRAMGCNKDQVLYCPDLNSKMWATEIVYYGKDVLNKWAIADGYDALIWQGIDRFYESKEDFDKLIYTAMRNGPEASPQIVGALVAGRNRPDYPVCRVFKSKNNNISTEQIELTPQAFHGHSPTPVPGYIGSDATLIKKWLLSRSTIMSRYEHWHERPNKDTPLGELGPEEWFMYQAIKRFNTVPVCHTGIRPWHAHESGLTVRYPDQECDISDLAWS